MELAYKRILLKISGEVLAGGKGMGIDPQSRNASIWALRSVLLSAAEISGADARAEIWTEPEPTI